MSARLVAGVSVVVSAYAGVFAVRMNMPGLLGLSVFCFLIAIFAASMEQLLHEGVEQVGKDGEGHEKNFGPRPTFNKRQVP